MKYLNEHNIIILKDKDYENSTRESLSKTILFMNDHFLWNVDKDEIKNLKNQVLKNRGLTDEKNFIIFVTNF